MKVILFTSLIMAYCISQTSNFSTNLTKVQTQSDTTHAVGERFGGGIVFFVSEGGKHGLIAAEPKLRELVTWSNGKTKLTGTSEEEKKYSGIENTFIIVNLLSVDNPNGNFAAKACIDYIVKNDDKTYDDWYLPSKKELNILFQNKEKVGDFDDRYYWTSNEVNTDEAWLQSFYDGRQLNVTKTDENYFIPIRAF
ncbi:MAG: DUF1566 domain-containing protein [Bacteroidetes bacterium]|nr:DUF1566 domain-containing protein [Bacteroidota bacterium]MBS1632275.1 DUF1566 domain-containing protein [Bacteroidota bacterium]